jgi:hypothetical protein
VIPLPHSSTLTSLNFGIELALFVDRGVVGNTLSRTEESIAAISAVSTKLNIMGLDGHMYYAKWSIKDKILGTLGGTASHYYIGSGKR